MAPIGGIGSQIGANFGSALELLDANGGTGKAKRATGADAVEGSGSGTPDFGAVLKSKLTELNATQADSAKASQDMATGRVDDIAQTMLRIEQANVSLQMATQMRNKVIESYQEIMRMQM